MARTFAVVLFSLLAGAARAEDASVSVTDTLIGEVHGNNENHLNAEDGPRVADDDYAVVINRLNVNGNADGLTADVRVDSATFVGRPFNKYKSDVRLERITVGYSLGDLEIRGGDFFQQLGRGIALSIRKQDEIGLDIAIRGAELTYSSDLHGVTLFGGLVNPANVDAVSQKHVKDPGDVLAGATYELRAFDAFTVGAHGILLQPRQGLADDSGEYVDTTGGGGLFVEAPLDSVSLYLEADVQRRWVSMAGSHWGYGGYGTADLAFGDTQILLEGIYLHDYELRGSNNSALNNRFVYNRVPTLQRVEEEVLLSPDVLGARLKLEHYFAEADLVVYANGLFNLANFGDEVALVRQLHGWGGLEWTFGEGSSRLNLSGGFRDERNDISLVRRMPHAEGDFLLPLGARFAVHVTSNIEVRTVPVISGGPDATRTYVRGSSFAGLERASLGGVTFELGYDTQDASGAVRQLFYAGIVSWEIMDELEVTATAGTQRGGIKCISGVCREFPAFAGGRIEVVGRL